MPNPANSNPIPQLETHSDPVSVWIVQLRAADELAARKIWKHFAIRLIAIDRKSCRASTRRAYDEEDAVQSMFRSKCGEIAKKLNFSRRTIQWEGLELGCG